MDFQNVNSLNVRLNVLSGNFLPMTSDDGSSFSIAWRTYSAITWLIIMIQICATSIVGVLIPKEILQDGGTTALLVGMEVFVLMTRMNERRDLIGRLIQKLNNTLRSNDETMKSLIRSTVRPIQIPLAFYCIAGSVSLILWCFMPLVLIFNRTHFSYKDFRVPFVVTKQSFSIETFFLVTIFICIACVSMFVKKVALDVYTINFVLLATVQYRYIATKLVTIFHGEGGQDDVRYFKRNPYAKREIKALCRHHNSLMHIIPMLKELLSSNMSLMYLSNVFRYSFLGIMLITAALSSDWLEIFVLSMYTLGSLVQLYIFCLSVQQLLNASTEITSAAFHENWYQYDSSLKRIFLSFMMSNKLVCKLSKYAKYNLSLASFVTILNQSYSIALLFLKVK